VPWDVEYTDQFGSWWFHELTEEQQEAIAARVTVLEAQGPGLRRPYVGEIKGSAFDPKMKELICNEGGALRILFMFDPRSVAILLLGGDKTGQWQRWYGQAIPQADELYREHLKELQDEEEN
jgi:hypothetical protein